MKKDIVSRIKNRKPFFISFLALLIAGFIYLGFSTDASLAFPVSGHFPFLVNVFLINVTFMGDTVFAVCLALIMFFFYKRKREGLAVFISFALTETAVQFHKNLGASSAGCRLFFEDGQTRFFNNPDLAGLYAGSISGHTAIAFALATVMMLILKNTRWQFPLLAGAVLLGISRMYLAGHWLSDILIAAGTGTISGLLAYCLSYGSLAITNRRKYFIRLLYRNAKPGHAVQPVHVQ